MMNVLQPTRFHNYLCAEIFFVSECNTLDLYSCFIVANDKYYSALRPISEPSEGLTRFLELQGFHRVIPILLNSKILAKYVTYITQLSYLRSMYHDCLLYTSDAADDLLCVDLG